MTFRSVFTLALASLAAVAAAPSAFAQSSEAASAGPFTTTGNLTLVSDYRFRGISQTYRQPALQGGVELAHSSGLYVGLWGSNVSGNSYNNGNSLEADIYGGYRFEPIKDLNADIGALFYLYPGAKLNSAPGMPSNNKYDNGELFVSLTSGPFNAKLSYTVTDYFGLDGETAGYAYFSALPANGGSKGSAYVELNYSTDIGDKLMLGAHVGHTVVRHYGDLSYTDYKVSLAKDWAGFTFGAALVGSNADKNLYQVVNSGGFNAKKSGTTAVVVSVAKAF
ncbi:MAG: hypothetical protein JWP52_813 [Rhizobacter sp.]|nr:hypothetical protein [Rhizobacter sp.]